ncbi:hypothetical protein JCM11641_006657 [Rhodosporidiobolus odoratus]
MSYIASTLAAQADTSYEEDPYGYGLQGPSLALNATFLALFILSFILHVGQLGISRRYWWMAVMPVGCACEILGWAARVWSHYNLPGDGFIIQICVLVLAPTFFSAALYWSGGLIIEYVAPARSRWLSPKWFKIIFLTADIVSLVIQGIGGGMAGSAAGDDLDQLNRGSDIMLAGIIIQLVIMIFFSFYMLAWGWAARREIAKSGSRMQLFIAAIGVASAAIIIRGGFRTAELKQGFRGSLAENELMILFDGIPVAVASFLLNFFHPHWFLRLSPTALPSPTLSGVSGKDATGSRTEMLQTRNAAFDRV